MYLSSKCSEFCKPCSVHLDAGVLLDEVEVVGDPGVAGGVRPAAPLVRPEGDHADLHEDAGRVQHLQQRAPAVALIC